MIMTLLIALVVIIGAILLVVAVLAMRNRDPLAEMRNNAASAPQRDPFDEVTGAAEFGPDRLAPGAIIVYGATDYVVRGTLVVQQGPFTWYEHLLDGGDGASWLGVEVDEGQLELVWWTTRKQALHPQSPLDFEGVTMKVSVGTRSIVLSARRGCRSRARCGISTWQIAPASFV